MKIRKLSRREMLIGTIAAAVAVGGLAYHFVLEPAFLHMVSLHKEIKEKTFLVGKQQGLIERGQDLRTLYAQYEKTLGGTHSTEEVLTALFEEVSQAAQEMGLKVKKVKPLSSLSRSNYHEAVLEVDLEGDFPALFRFVNALETKTSFLKINALHISSPSDSSALRLSVILSKIYF